MKVHLIVCLRDTTWVFLKASWSFAFSSLKQDWPILLITAYYCSQLKQKSHLWQAYETATHFSHVFLADVSMQELIFKMFCFSCCGSIRVYISVVQSAFVKQAEQPGSAPTNQQLPYICSGSRASLSPASIPVESDRQAVLCVLHVLLSTDTITEFLVMQPQR